MGIILNRDLLILSCSQSKRSSQEKLTGLERYNGPTFRVLRKFLKQHPTTPLDIYIVSAQFGLISSQELIPHYDQKMTKTRSQELNSSLLEKLEQIFHQNDYQRLLICVTQNYLPVLQGYEAILPQPMAVTVATVTLGRKLSVLHQWLYGEASPSLCQNIMTNHPGTVVINGVKLNLTKVKILEVARQALAEKKGKPYNYQTWYVLVDEQRVSPKWLVSEITGLQVSSFHSQAARRVLQQVGIEVYSETF